MIRLAQPIMIGAEYAQPLDVGTRACAGPSRRIMIRLAQPIMIGWVAALARQFVPKGLHHLSSPTHPGAELSHTSQPILRLSVIPRSPQCAAPSSSVTVAWQAALSPGRSHSRLVQCRERSGGGARGARRSGRKAETMSLALWNLL